MAKISFSKEELSGNVYPEGLYELRLEGFEPSFSKQKTSINLNPTLKIVNHQTLNGKRVFENLNSGASWIIESFCHAFGFLSRRIRMVEETCQGTSLVPTMTQRSGSM